VRIHRRPDLEYLSAPARVEPLPAGLLGHLLEPCERRGLVGGFSVVVGE
jgi:hypothetical protein